MTSPIPHFSTKSHILETKRSTNLHGGLGLRRVSNKVRHSRHVVFHIEAERYGDPLTPSRRSTLVTASSRCSGDGGGTAGAVGLVRCGDDATAATRYTHNRQQHQQLATNSTHHHHLHLTLCSLYKRSMSKIIINLFCRYPTRGRSLQPLKLTTTHDQWPLLSAEFT